MPGGDAAPLGDRDHAPPPALDHAGQRRPHDAHRAEEVDDDVLLPLGHVGLHELSQRPDNSRVGNDDVDVADLRHRLADE
jgi:hypothetical protein